jgi:hypothetical protein
MQISTGRLIEMQSDGDNETMISNAINAGFTRDDIEIRDVTETEFASILDAQPKQQPTPLQQLEATDWQMARAAEDLINALITKGVIAENDLPQVVLDKIAYRQQLRDELNIQ